VSGIARAGNGMVCKPASFPVNVVCLVSSDESSRWEGPAGGGSREEARRQEVA